MGYRGKLVERERARQLRAESWTLLEIARELGVSKSSVSTWVRDVEFTPRPRNRGHPAGPKHPMRLKKEAQIEHCRVEAAAWAVEVGRREFFAWGLAMYHAEGAKTEASSLTLANTSDSIVAGYLRWLREFFDIDESRLRGRLYLHVGLDEQIAVEHWADVTGIPVEQFSRTYRAEIRGTVKRTKHQFGCLSVRYSDRALQRRVIAFAEALACAVADPG